MTRPARRSALAAAFLLAVATVSFAVPGLAQTAGNATIDGTWEGPWYRGMSSGRATFQIKDGAGTLQLTNGESFGEQARALTKVSFDDKAFRFQVDGGGGPLTAALKLNDRGDQMKGMGKYEGFGVRFELTRVAK